MNDASAVQVTELADIPSAQREGWLRDIYDHLLAPNFPPNELVSAESFLRMAKPDSPTSRVAAVRDGDGVPLGTIVGEWFANSRVLLISYLAIREGLRGRGLGTRLVQSTLQDWAASLSATLVLGEVEDPLVVAAEAMPGQDPAARVRLYGRLGAHRLDMPYIQPELSPGAGRVRSMFLIVAPPLSPAVGLADGALSVPSRLLVEFLTEYFAGVEGPGYADAEFNELVANVGRGSTVAVRPLPV